MKRNEILKARMRSDGVPQWKVASELGISENTLYRQLRQDISEEVFIDLNKTIDKIQEGDVNE